MRAPCSPVGGAGEPLRGRQTPATRIGTGYNATQPRRRLHRADGPDDATGVNSGSSPGGATADGGPAHLAAPTPADADDRDLAGGIAENRVSGRRRRAGRR